MTDKEFKQSVFDNSIKLSFIVDHLQQDGKNGLTHTQVESYVRQLEGIYNSLLEPYNPFKEEGIQDNIVCVCAVPQGKNHI